MNIAMDLIREALLGGSGGGGGGGGGATLVYSTEVEASTSSSTATTLKTATLEESVRDKNKLTCVVYKDKAGKRNGYLYGGCVFFIWYGDANGQASTTGTNAGYTIKVDANGKYVVSSGTSYGITVTYEKTGTEITIKERYNSNDTGTIDGTFSVQLYQIPIPGGDFFV